MHDFELRSDNHGIGQVLIMKGPWNKSVAGYMQENGISALRLTDSFGFKAQDLSFLSSLDFLRSLEIYCWDAKGVQVLEQLPQLEILGLQFKSSRKVDFASFRKLRVAGITWAKGLSSILKLDTIEDLNIQNYPYVDLEPIAHMKYLSKLYLTSRKLQTLGGIDRLRSLEELDLYNCQRLSTLNGTEAYPDLRLEIEACNAIGT